MSEQTCKECGFFYIETDAEKCYKLQKVNSAGDSDCKTFITRRYDDDEPFTPAEHEWFLQHDSEKKKMRKIQGLRF